MSFSQLFYDFVYEEHRLTRQSSDRFDFKELFLSSIGRPSQAKKNLSGLVWQLSLFPSSQQVL